MQNYNHMDHNQGNDKNENSPSETRYRSLPSIPGVRPMVDPQADGSVNPDTYPQPKEVTHKIRCKNDFIEYLFGAIDQELLTVKTFYFFFYSAFGSLFPLMGVYFKQMGMNACQCGLLIGLRPFIEFISAPFWGSWADRWQKGKLLLLASLSCWIIFTLPLGFIQPPAVSCIIYNNHTSYLYIPHSSERIIKRSVLSDIAQLPDKSSLHLINVLEDVKDVQRLHNNEEGHFDNRERKVNNKTSIYEMNHLSMKPLLGLNEASNKKAKLFQDVQYELLPIDQNQAVYN